MGTWKLKWLSTVYSFSVTRNNTTIILLTWPNQCLDHGLYPVSAKQFINEFTDTKPDNETGNEYIQVYRSIFVVTTHRHP